MCKKLLILTSFMLVFGLAGNAFGIHASGNILFEYWFDIGGTAVSDLTGQDSYPDNPDDGELRDKFEGPVDWADNYGARARGWLFPPEDGDYTFWISGDDYEELYLSTDTDPANAVLIAQVPGWTSHLEWDKYPEQQSAPVTLSAGAGGYYIEAIMKEGGGGDSMTVGWTGPFIGEEITIIDGVYLAPADWSPSLLKAGSPVPADGAVDVDVALLEWASGKKAVSHVVYLNGELLAETEMNLVGADLAPGTAYSWKVDEVQEDGTVIEGSTWSFTTLPLEAHFPSPEDGAENIASPVTLSWTPGKNTIINDVYFGTDLAAVEARDMSTFKVKAIDASYDTGPLDLFATYYWAVDEFTPAGTVAGPVWSFSTEKFVLVADEVTVNYDNTAEPFVTEVAIDTIADLTAGGVVSDLTLSFQGNGPALSVDEETGTYMVTGEGADVWGSADQFHYVYMQLTGDGEITARVVDNGSGSNSWAKGGVMIRESTDPSSPHAIAALTGGDGGGITFQGRWIPGERSHSFHGDVTASPPYWVKLTRVGNDITGSYSADGVEWMPMTDTTPDVEVTNPQPVEMTDTVLIGLFVTSHADGENRTYTFDNVDIQGDVDGVIVSEGIDSASGNSAEQIYVAIEDATGAVAAVAHPYPAATQITSDRAWTIPLGDFEGVDPAAAAKLYIGVGNGEAGGKGSITVSDIKVVEAVIAGGPKDITAPGDIVKGIPDDGDWPGGEPPAYAIDDDSGTKYLHFKGDFDPDPGTGGSGIKITPLNGASVVTGLSLTTANDVPGRDPIAFELYGSNESIDGPYELIAAGDVVDFAGEVEWPRFTKNSTPIIIENDVAYAHYQLILTAIRGPVGGSVNSMQIAEIELLEGVVDAELVAAFAFGSRNLECPVYNVPSDNYTMVLHEGDYVEGIQYDPNKGYGYEVLYPVDSPFGDRSGFGILGPFDDSPNNRNEFPDVCPEQLYDSFIGAKNFTNEVSAATMGDMFTPGDPPEGIIFRVDVPDGFYRFVGAFGEADNGHAHRILAEDGGSGPPENVGANHVVLVHNHDQSQYDIGEIEGDEPGDAVFARVGFSGLIPPPGDGLPPSPVFVDMDEFGVPTDAGADSPMLWVTQGYIRIHQLQGNSNDSEFNSRDANGGDIVALELWKVPAPLQTLTISSTNGGSVTTPGEGTFVYDKGTEVEVKATADDLYYFLKWTGSAVDAGKVADPGSANTTVFVDGDYDLKAVFAAVSFNLKVTSTDGGEVIKPGEGQFTVSGNYLIDLKAEAFPHYHFKYWSGSAVAADMVVNKNKADTSIFVLGNYDVKAHFAKDTFFLDISSTEGGSVTSPGEGTFEYGYGSEVSVTATPDEHYTFVGWSGSAVDAGKVSDPTSASTSVTVHGSYSLVANFEKMHTLTISSNYGGSVTTPGEGTFEYAKGTEVSLVATPEDGYRFKYWTGPVADTTSASTTVTVTDDVAIEALFVKTNPQPLIK